MSTGEPEWVTRRQFIQDPPYSFTNTYPPDFSLDFPDPSDDRPGAMLLWIKPIYLEVPVGNVTYEVRSYWWDTLVVEHDWTMYDFAWGLTTDIQTGFEPPTMRANVVIHGGNWNLMSFGSFVTLTPTKGPAAPHNRLWLWWTNIKGTGSVIYNQGFIAVWCIPKVEYTKPILIPQPTPTTKPKRTLEITKSPHKLIIRRVTKPVFDIPDGVSTPTWTTDGRGNQIRADQPIDYSHSSQYKRTRGESIGRMAERIQKKSRWESGPTTGTTVQDEDRTDGTEQDDHVPENRRRMGQRQDLPGQSTSGDEGCI